MQGRPPLFPTAAGTHFLFTRPHTSTSKVSHRCASLTAIIRDLHHQAGSESGSASATCRTVAVQLRGNGTDLDTIHRLLGLSSLSAVKCIADSDRCALALTWRVPSIRRSPEFAIFLQGDTR